MTRKILVLAAALWIALASIELFLHLVNAESVIRSAQLPISLRLGAIGLDLLLIWLFLLLGIVIATAAALFLPRRPTLRRLGKGTFIFLLWIIFFLYGASWGFFYATTHFLTGDSLLFWAAQPIQVFHWVPMDFAFSVLGTSLAAALTFGHWMPQKIPALSAGLRNGIFTAGIALISLCAAAAFNAERTAPRSAAVIRDDATGASYSIERLYRVLRHNRSGVFAHFWNQLFGEALTPAVPVRADQSIEVIRPPIISTEEYLSNIDRATVQPFNVVLILLESMRADILKPYGGKTEVMPAIEALAAESQLFRKAYTQASHSDYASPVPLCSQYPLRWPEAQGYPEAPGYPRVMLYEVLKALGYQTAVFSSQNEQWGKMINYHRTQSLDRFFHAETFDGPTYVMLGDVGMAHWVKQTGHAGSVDDGFTVGEAMTWISSVKGERFFASVNLQNAHFPYVVPPGFKTRFGPASLNFPMLFGHFPRAKLSQVQGRYADSLAYVDSQIGRLLEYLKQEGLWENTLIVLTSDHGQAFYEHGFAAHAGKLYDEVMRVPLMVRVPALKPRFHNRPAQHVDIAPSILHLLGLPPHPGFQGMNPLANHSKRHSIYMMAQTPLAHQYALIRDGYKLIYDVREGLYFLYDLSRDPRERRELSFRQPKLLAQMAGRLQRWYQEQIDYYQHPERQKTEFPPVILE